MDKRVLVHLQASRKVTGQLRGFDLFLNLVLDDAHDESVAGEKTKLGQTVSVYRYELSRLICLLNRSFVEIQLPQWRALKRYLSNELGDKGNLKAKYLYK